MRVVDAGEDFDLAATVFPHGRAKCTFIPCDLVTGVIWGLFL